MAALNLDAELAVSRKISKCVPLLPQCRFVPLTFETINNAGLVFITELVRFLAHVSRDGRETRHLFQRLPIGIQHFNTVV